MNNQVWTEAYRKGDHAIQVYSNDVERLRTVCDILEWIDDDELLVYLVDDPRLDALNHGNRALVNRFNEGIVKGKLRLKRSTPFYLENGAFDLETRIDEWTRFVKDVHDEGYKGLVVVGDLSWSANSPSLFAEVLKYEARLSISGLPKGLTAVCQYDSRLFTQKEIDFIESVHELQLRGGNLRRNFWLLSHRYY